MPMSQFVDQTNQCVEFFTVAFHMASTGYSSNWYDRENVTQSSYVYTFQAPQATSDLFVIAESWYYNVIPQKCQTGTIGSTSGTTSAVASTGMMPIVYVNIVKSDGTDLGTTASETYATPMVLTPSQYTAGETFTVTVQYFFPTDSPFQDYTLSVYSTMDLQILDSDGNTNELNMDGQSPSGFRYHAKDVYVAPPTSGGV